MPFNIGALVGYLKLEGAPQFNSQIRSAQSSLDLTAATARRAGVAIDQTSTALRGAGRQADVASAGSTRYRAAQLQLVAAQERYNKLTADSTASTGRLAAAQASLLRAQQQVARSEPVPPVAKLDAFGSKLRGIIGDTAKMAAGFAVIGGIFELGNAIKQANEFQRQMLLIQTQAGASAAQVKTLTTAVLGLSPQVATSPEQLAVALYHIESAGRGLQSTSQMLDTLKIAAEGAKIGNADLEATTNALTSTIASGISGVKDMSGAMGILNATVGAGDMKLSDLNEALGSGLLSVVKAYGLSLRDVGAALATFGDNNIRGANAATMLRMAVQSMAVPMKAGQASLELLGLKSNTLAHDMASGGLNKAILDLSDHLKQVGKGQEITDLSNQMQSFNGQVDATTVQASSLGETLTTIFGKRAGPGLAVLLAQTDRLQEKYRALDQGAKSFGAAWDATTKTASFGFDKLKASAEATGISIFSKVGPALGQVASDVGVVLPAALHALGSALAPVGIALGAVAHLLESSGGAAKAIAGIFRDLEPILSTVGAAVVGMWLGFKAGELVVATVRGVQSAIETMALKVMYARDAMAAFGSTATVAATESAAAGAVIAGSAEETSASVVASGASAEAGWAGLAGPIGAAVVGIGVMIAMFHKSAGASKEATAAAKAYTDALKASGGNVLSGDVTSSIVDQLSKNNVPETIEKLNKALGGTQFSGKAFVDAIQQGGPALATLRGQLNGVISSLEKAAGGGAHGAPVFAKDLPTYRAASKLLADLNAQFGGLSAAAQKEISDFNAFGMVATSIDQVSSASEVGSQTAQTYAQMLGIVVDKNGVAAVSSDALNKAITTVATAYNTATATGSEFLTALNAFSQSAGTAADRAALIGATLKAANGDNLAYAGSMNGLAQATSTFATDMASNAKTAGVSVRTYFDSLVDLKKGTIDYNKAAAGPLISDLQGIQTAAMNAAEATYQHNIATLGSKKAADLAYTSYNAMTTGALSRYLISLGFVDNKTKGLNATGQKLLQTYFGMPKDVKTKIEQEGADPVVTVLNQIGNQLSFLTGHPWVPTIDVNTDAAVAKINALAGKISGLGPMLAASQGSKTGLFPSAPSKPAPHTSHSPNVQGNAAGGGLPEGVSAVGEGGAELAVKSGPNVQILSNSQSRRFLAATGMRAPGFADGTVGDFTVAAGSKAAGTAHTNKVKVTLDSVSITAGGGAAYGIAALIKGNISQSKMAMRDLSAAVNEAFQLNGVQKKLAAVQADLKQLKSDASSLRSGVESTLTGSVDVSKYADLGGLESALGNQTGANKNFAAELNKLKKEGAPAGLLQKLAEAGPSAGLDTLAGASLGDAKKAFGAFNAYMSSAVTGGNAAYQDVYGARIAADQKSVALLSKSQVAMSHDIARLVAAVARVTHLPTSVSLDGHILATAVIKDKAFDGVMNEITHHLEYA